MQISSIVYFLYKHNNQGWMLKKEFGIRAPLAVTMNWHTLRDNNYGLIRHLDINQTLFTES